MPRITVVPATPERWADMQVVFGGPWNIDHCWCQFVRLSSSDYAKSTFEQRTGLLESQTHQDPVPGMVAYVDGEPCGWIGFGVRSRMERLVRSRTIPLVDDVPVWSVFCFLIRVGYRRQGVAQALLDGLVEYARQQGSPMLEAYPVETNGKRIHGSGAYVGLATMFRRAGFSEILQTDARAEHLPRILMRLDLRETADSAAGEVPTSG